MNPMLPTQSGLGERLAKIEATSISLFLVLIVGQRCLVPDHASTNPGGAEPAASLQQSAEIPVAQVRMETATAHAPHNVGVP